MSYKVLDLFQDLPQTNCKDCGAPGCFAFATAVYLKQRTLADCPHLEASRIAELERQLLEGGEQLPRKNHEQAMVALLETLNECDWPQVAERSGAAFVAGSPDTLKLDFLTGSFAIDADGVTVTAGPDPTVWVKIFLLIYLTRSQGQSPQNQWVAFRELPNTVSKVGAFDAALEKIAVHFSGSPTALAETAQALGGEILSPQTADVEILFRPLPRVPLKLLFWDGDEDFPARVSALLDKGVLDHLDQEASVFLVETFAAILCGDNPDDVIP